MVISLLRVLIMQNSEDIIFSRIQQLDSSFVRSSFSLVSSHEEFTLKKIKNEQSAAHYISSYLIFVLHTSVNELLMHCRTLTGNKHIVSTLVEMLEMYFLLISYIAKSGKEATEY